MKKYYPFSLILACCLCSCASLLNGPQEKVNIFTSIPAQAVVGQDTITSVNRRIQLRVNRSAQPLRVKLLAGDQTNVFEIASRNSFAFWFNLYANYGLGMLVDNNNPRRYSYPRKIFIDPLDPVGGYRLWQPGGRDQQFAVKIFLPYLNLFHYRPDLEPDTKANGGFWGIGFGLDFHHQPDQYVELSIATQTNFFVPIPAAVEVVDEYEFVRSEEITLTNNHFLGRFSLGYGISFSNNIWEFRSGSFFSSMGPSRRPAERATAAIGLSFPVQYYTGDHFYFKMHYRPGFWRFSSIRPFAYEHLLSFGFGWDVWL